jgi:hypothetical protein
MLEVDFDDRQEEYALKVPAYGTPKKNWQEEDGNLLHSEANFDRICSPQHTYSYSISRYV